MIVHFDCWSPIAYNTVCDHVLFDKKKNMRFTGLLLVCSNDEG